MERHRVIGDVMSKALETKTQVIDILKNKPMTVSELSRKFGLSRATIAQHIKELEEAGAIEEIPNVYFKKHVSYKAKRLIGKTILNDAKMRWNTGNVLFEEHKLSKALEEFSAAIAIDPKYADAYFNRALIEYMTGKSDSARKDLIKTLELHPKSHDAAVLLGDIERKHGNLKKAEEWYEKSLEYYPYYDQAKARLATMKKR